MSAEIAHLSSFTLFFPLRESISIGYRQNENFSKKRQWSSLPLSSELLNFSPG